MFILKYDKLDSGCKKESLDNVIIEKAKCKNPVSV